ncbi:isopentenyl-diphosphate delta-isomerase [Bacillus sp. SORGH_AS 510]|uniref:type 2 isopentenyl-diphosphate Delta-isomerase n=1 Tax=Bacillus sp. SORGH_AS_0510 TaxID=3041771 RepID=UPI00277EB5FF|nr:type 2 isopentenyl-diphosphate Delta-isomerase [Bacillus sp. SORGH_AS_0510]MDQ1146653.1 isopentenyl-diphosphate delta-isomerase [Bacillus sp. SORGH_AS_0510]
MGTNTDINQRKDDHIHLCLHEEVTGRGISTGFEQFRFIHQALPEINFSDINTESFFLGKRIKMPYLISSMTGGTEMAYSINKNLAQAAQEKGWALGLGSARAAVESPAQVYTFQVRKYAPDIPIIANIGAVQLNNGFGIDECKRVVDMSEADALVLHLNSLQELIQPEGNTNFKGLFKKIEVLCQEFPLPIGIKEVGWGINGVLAKRFFEAGVSFIDLAGAGGTSWSQVEKLRSSDSLKIAVAEALKDWGLSTTDCLIDVKSQSAMGTTIASGGLKNGVEAAKAIALGADLVGFGRSILLESVDSLIQRFTQLEWELKAAMFGIGTDSIDSLKNTKWIKRL